MLPAKNLKISLEELSLKGQQIHAQRSEITYEQAVAQVQWLKQTSKVSQSSKKSRPIHIYQQIFIALIFVPVLYSCGSIKAIYKVAKSNPLYLSDTTALMHVNGPALVYYITQEHYINNTLKNNLDIRLQNKLHDTIYLKEGSSVSLGKNSNFIDRAEIEKNMDSVFGGKVVAPMQQVNFYYYQWSADFKGSLDYFKQSLSGERMTIKIVYSTSAERSVIHTDSLTFVPVVKK